MPANRPLPGTLTDGNSAGQTLASSRLRRGVNQPNGLTGGSGKSSVEKISGPQSTEKDADGREIGGDASVNCPACGNPVAAGENFCRRCGYAVAAPAIAQPVASAQPAAPPAETSGKAIASLLCGLLFFIFPAAILAIIFGHLSYSQIRRSAGRLKGEGIAIAGLVLGYVGIAFIPIFLIIAAIAIPNLLRARQAANESSAVASVRTIVMAEETFVAAHPDAGYACSLSDLAATGLIDAGLASGQKNGYNFQIIGCAPGEASPGRYRVLAIPVTAGQTGTRAFCADESAVIRVDAHGSAQGCMESGSPQLQ